MASVEYTGTPESIEAIKAIRSTGFTVKDGELLYKGTLVPIGTVFSVDGEQLIIQKPYK